MTSARTSLGSRTLRLTATQCRAVDRYAIDVLGIPGLVLMENAGRNAADLIEKIITTRPGFRRVRRPAVSIVCGKGNNGGDGFVIARHLSGRGFNVAVDLLGDPSGLSPDAAVNHAILVRMGIPIHRLDVPRALTSIARRWRRSATVVDALLGTGFSGEVREPLADVIRKINALEGPRVVAVDVPSGLNADTGKPGGVAVRAHYTITFLAAKAGFGHPAAKTCLGRVCVADIGAPLSWILAQLKKTATD
jgi:NAD(P)H-hydrate epimerase